MVLLLVPFFKLLTSFGGRGLSHVVVHGWDGSHILLVVGSVELVRKVALFDFGEPKGFGKRREGHLKETEGIDETDVVVFDFQEFAAIAELFYDLVVGVVLVYHKVPIVSLKIVSNDVDSSRVVQGQGIQPFEKIFYTLVSG